MDQELLSSSSSSSSDDHQTLVRHKKHYYPLAISLLLLLLLTLLYFSLPFTRPPLVNSISIVQSPANPSYSMINKPLFSSDNAFPDLDIPQNRKQMIEWNPKQNRFLIVMCLSGQMSICLAKHVFLDVVPFEEEDLKRLKGLGKVEAAAAWTEDGKGKVQKRRVLEDVKGKFEVVAIGNMFYADVDEGWAIIVTSQRFAQAFLGRSYDALKFWHEISHGVKAPTFQFDYFQLVFQYQRNKCMNITCKREYNGVQEYTIHGLWPSSRRGKIKCPASLPLFTKDISSLNTRLTASWPSIEKRSCEQHCSADDFFFWAHEWKVHGGCSKSQLKDPKAFFGFALELADQVKANIKFKGSGFMYYTMDFIKDVIYTQTGFRPALRCNTEKGKKKNDLLTEVSFCVKISQPAESALENCTASYNIRDTCSATKEKKIRF